MCTSILCFIIILCVVFLKIFVPFTYRTISAVFKFFILKAAFSFHSSNLYVKVVAGYRKKSFLNEIPVLTTVLKMACLWMKKEEYHVSFP